MRSHDVRWLLGSVLVALASVSSAAVTVQFVEPQRFLDGTMEGYREPAEANRVIVEIRKHFLALGTRCIAAEQSLTIMVRELDLGGHYEWQQRASTGNVRVVGGMVWSRMTLEYVWQSSDATLLGRSVDLLNHATFLGSDTSSPRSNVALPDEKAMMTEWFAERFCKDVKASSSRPRRQWRRVMAGASTTARARRPRPCP